jgi:hypothetical protein
MFSESQCLPQAHDVFATQRHAGGRELRHRLHSMCSTPLLLLFELVRVLLEPRPWPHPFLYPQTVPSGAWKAKGLLSVRTVDSGRSTPGADAGAGGSHMVLIKPELPASASWAAVVMQKRKAPTPDTRQRPGAGSSTRGEDAAAAAVGARREEGGALRFAARSSRSRSRSSSEMRVASWSDIVVVCCCSC